VSASDEGVVSASRAGATASRIELTRPGVESWLWVRPGAGTARPRLNLLVLAGSTISDQIPVRGVSAFLLQQLLRH
jgi:hypothetical protein